MDYEYSNASSGKKSVAGDRVPTIDLDSQKNQNNEEENGVVVPMERIPPDALQSMLEDFVTRDGGHTGSLDVAVEQVRQQIRSGKASIHFCLDSHSFQIVPT